MRFRFHLSVHAVLAFLLAANYFAFRVELFDEEYEANHRTAPTQLAFSSLSINWESFDKDNAPKAFVVNTETTIQLLYVLYPKLQADHALCRPFQPVRDKSPPVDFTFI